MPPVTLVTLLLIAVNVAVSMVAFGAFRSGRAPERFLFEPARVVRGENLDGMLRSRVSHADGGHLIFNMVTLFFFGPVVETALGPLAMIGIYLASEVGATLLNLASHYHDPTYRSLGASGAISGVLFAAIVLQPTMGIYIYFIPIAIPAPVFAVAYVAYSYFGARRRLGNVGHDAHLGGAVTGFLLAGWLAPDGFHRVFAAIQHLLH